MFRGVLHAHSTYSDGELTLRELRDTFRASGCRFLVVTDHADAFTRDSLAAYRDECEGLSDDEFVMVPSLEYGCERRLHVLGYGSTDLIATTDPQGVIRTLRGAGAIAVIAHPQNAALDWIESFAELPDGIEVWNTKYDGRYAPRPQTFGLLRRLQAQRAHTLAFYGLDFHWRTQPRGLFVEVDANELAARPLLSALAAGRFEAVKGTLRLPSNGAVSEALLARFGAVNARATRVKRFLVAARNIAGRFGATVPASVKARLRRLF